MNKHFLQACVLVLAIFAGSYWFVGYIGAVFFGPIFANEDSGVAASAEQWPVLGPFEGKPSAISFATSYWPKVKAHCPGFKRFASDMSFKQLRDMRGDGSSEMDRLEIVFKISDEPLTIPASFLAHRQTCGFGVSPDGDNIRIQKDRCASVCLGYAIRQSHDYVAPL